jgi:adenylate cyclase
VIAGEVGSTSLGYTTIGEQVGMAQRMEAAAAPGGVMLSQSTARLVDGSAALGESELVRIKGADEPVRAHLLLGMGEEHRAVGRAESNLVGRRWEMSAVEGVLDRAIDGHGAVVGIIGPPGIGKSRLVRELSAMASARGVDAFTTFCESHTSQIPFHAIARLLRVAFGVEGLDTRVARDGLRDRVPDADPEDVLLLDDLLGIADPNTALPPIDPGARRRRLTAVVNAASLARENPVVFVVEDAHWIDDVSESMLVDFLMVIPQTPSLVLVSYRPEYEGALTRVHGAQAIALAPLSNSETATLITELLGPDPSVGALGQTIADRAAGNPFFAEEIVRELAERDVLRGETGAYISTAEVAEVSVPATLQAAIAARIDRLEPQAKRTLSAAAVVGSRFGTNLLRDLGIEPVVDDLLVAQLIDQITFSRHPEYVFHHPLIRTVAYEAQLKSDRAELHRRVASAIESRDPAAADENAALIAEHLQAAGDAHAAYSWHMRAGAWSNMRDNLAAAKSWRKAQQVADQLPENDPDRLSMRIAPRTLLCATQTSRVGGGAELGFDELRELCVAAEDERSLAIGMAGRVMERLFNGWPREASELASEHVRLLESIGDPALTLGLLSVAMSVKHEMGEIAEILRLAQRAIDLAAGDPTKGELMNGSPLALATAMRGLARSCLGIAGWKDDFQQAVRMSRNFEAITRAAAMYYTHTIAIMNGVVVPDETTVREAAETLEIAEQSGEDVALGLARSNLGVVLVHRERSSRARGVELLSQVRDTAMQQRYSMTGVQNIDIVVAQVRTMNGDLDRAIELSRAAVEELFDRGGMVWIPLATAVLAEALLQRGGVGDLEDARTAIERMASVPTEPGLVLQDIWLLRLYALLARANGDETAYRDFRDRYRDMATARGYRGHTGWAEAMP